jgi:autotransporter-associated beta strand protein
MNISAKFTLSVAARRLALLLVAVFAPCLLARADLRGPYTNDVNTLYLLHFDEAAGGSVAANVGSKGGNFYTVTNTTLLSGGGSAQNGLTAPPPVTNMLGYASYTNANGTNYGKAVTCTNIDMPVTNGLVGCDGNNNGAYDADVQGGPASPDAIAITNLNIGNGGQTPFTLEALICPTVINVNQEIICTDDYNGTRGFQFKITSTGTLQFNPIFVSGGSVSWPIPTTGTHKFVSGQWYHVAATYDGTTVRLYWTQLDPSNMVANLLTSQNVTIGASAAVVPLVIGAENRGSEQESFRGLIDEVRISSVCRSPNDMQLTSAGVVISPQPVSQKIDNYQPVTFTCGAVSPTLMGFQWRFKGTPIPNAYALLTNFSSYTISSVDLTNAGNYDCVVTNLYSSSATSQVATLTVGAGNFLAHRFSFTTTNATTPITTPDSIGTNGPGTNFGNAYVGGGALVLDGTTNTCLQLPNGYLHGPQAVTLEFWANFGTSGNNDRVFDFGNTNGTALGVGGQPNNYLFFSPHSGAVHRLTATGGTSEMEQSVSGSNTLDGLTMHVTCVVDPPDRYLAIYTNGVLEIANTNFTVQIGALDDQRSFIGRSLWAELNGDAYLNARIDEFRIYNGAMSAATVQLCDWLGSGILPSDSGVQFATQPANTTVSPGATATFSAKAVGHGTITYQWYSNSIVVLDATNYTLSITNVTLSANGAIFQTLATNNVTGTNYSAASSNATLTVHVPISLTWAGVGTDWDITSLNWTTNANISQARYTEADSVTFDSVGAAQPTVNLTAVLHPTAVAASGTTPYTLNGVGSIAGSASLIKSGASTLIIDTTNSYTGGTTVSGGTLQVGDGTYTGTLGSGPVTNNAALVVSPGTSGSVVLSNTISGSGSLTLSGSSGSGLVLYGNNSYSGGTTVSAGALHARSPSALGTGSALVSGNGAQIYVDSGSFDLASNSLTLNGSGVSSDGALRKGGASTTSFGGTVTLGSDTTLGVDGGATLNLTNASGPNGASVNANLILAGSGIGSISGPLALGTGNLTVNGGTWTVAPTNTYTGVTTINGGALRITGARSVGPVPASFNPSQITLGGGTLEAATNITFNDGNIGITLSASSTIAVDTNSTLTISNQIGSSSGLNLTKSGPGRLVLSGATGLNNYLYLDTASQTANDGMAVVANNDAIAGMLSLAGSPTIFFRSQNAGSGTLGLDGTLGSITVSQDISLNGRTTQAIENLAGNNSISGNFTLGSGGAYVLQSDSGTLNLMANWPYAVATNIVSSRNLIFRGAGTITMSGVLQDGYNTFVGISVPINLFKDGPGTLNLPAANTASGTTVVSNGVLALTGSIGTNTVTVAGGLLVSDGGTIAGPVTVLSGGTIEAGTTNTIGTLNLSRTLALLGNTVVKLNKSAANNDRFIGQTSVTYGGTLTVTNLAGTLTTNDSFTLFSPGASASNFGSIVGSPGVGLAYHFTNGVLRIVIGVPTYPPVMTNSYDPGSGQLTLSWGEEFKGYYRLQAQTNTLAAGLTTNWVEWTGGKDTNKVIVTIEKAKETVFFRLIYP